MVCVLEVDIDHRLSFDLYEAESWDKGAGELVWGDISEEQAKEEFGSITVKRCIKWGSLRMSYSYGRLFAGVK